MLNPLCIWYLIKTKRQNAKDAKIKKKLLREPGLIQSFIYSPAPISGFNSNEYTNHDYGNTNKVLRLEPLTKYKMTS